MKKNKWWKTICFLIVLMMGIVGMSGCTKATVSKDDENKVLTVVEKGNSEGNLLAGSDRAGGFLTESNDKIFYFDYSREAYFTPVGDGQGAIIKMNKDGSHKETIYNFDYGDRPDRRGFHNLNYLEGYLYFTDAEGNVIRLKEDGSDKTILFNVKSVTALNRPAVFFMLVLEDKIIWKADEWDSGDNLRCYYYDFETKSNVLVAKEETYEERFVNFDSEWIYYQNNLGYDDEKNVAPAEIRKVHYDGSSDTLVFKKDDIGFCGIVDKQIVFLDMLRYEDCNVYQLKIKDLNQDKDQIVYEYTQRKKDNGDWQSDKETIARVFLNGDKIYYVLSAEEGNDDYLRAVNMVDLQTQENKEIYRFPSNSHFSGYNMQLCENYMIYEDNEFQYMMVDFQKDQIEKIFSL